MYFEKYPMMHLSKDDFKADKWMYGFFGEPLTRLFIDGNQPEVVDTAMIYLKICAMFFSVPEYDICIPEYAAGSGEEFYAVDGRLEKKTAIERKLTKHM